MKYINSLWSSPYPYTNFELNSKLYRLHKNDHPTPLDGPHWVLDQHHSKSLLVHPIEQ